MSRSRRTTNFEQTHLLKQMRRYILAQALSNPAQYPKKHTRPAIQALNKTGHCFGFSVAYGAFNHVGKGEWWQTALEFISRFKFNRSNKFIAIDLKKLAGISSAGAPLTAEQVFELVINAVRFHQSPGSYLDNLGQLAALTPASDIFSISTPDMAEPIHCHAQCTFDAGHDQEGFISTLEPVLNNSDIVLITTSHRAGGHCCTVRRGEQGYIHYDPNNVHGEKGCTAAELFSDIRRISVGDIGLAAMALSPEKATSLVRLHQTKRPNINLTTLDNMSPTTLIEHHPELTPELINCYLQANKVDELLTHLGEQAPSGRKTAWKQIIKKTPAQIKTLLNAATSKSAQDLIIRAIRQHQEPGKNFLSNNLASKGRGTFIRFFNWLDPSSQNAVLESLKEKNQRILKNALMKQAAPTTRKSSSLFSTKNEPQNNKLGKKQRTPRPRPRPR